MEIGMLWFDNSSRSLDERVQRAADFYAEKYGRKPTLCMVNPTMLEAGDGAHNGIRLQAARSVMPNHFWIGVDESSVGPDPSGNGKSNGGEARAKGKTKTGARQPKSSAGAKKPKPSAGAKKRKASASAKKRKTAAGAAKAKRSPAAKGAKRSRSKGTAAKKGS